MGTSGHERLAVDDLNSTHVAGKWGERAGHFERTACEKTTFESSKKTKRRSNNTHNLVSCKEEMAEETIVTLATRTRRRRGKLSNAWVGGGLSLDPLAN